MILTTRDCGCPRPLQNSSHADRHCPSSCYTSVSRSECPQSPCCGSQFPSVDHVADPASTNQRSDTKNESESAPTRKVISEIARKGFPYNELQILINDNQLVLRTQVENMEEEYDPPCDCLNPVSDSVEAGNNSPGSNTCEIGKENVGENSGAGAECRTVTVYPEPRPRSFSADKPTAGDTEKKDKKEKKDKVEKANIPRAIDLEENPNIFILRVRKKCDNSDRRQIDLEFKIPRPWSRKMRMQNGRPSRAESPETMVTQNRKEKTPPLPKKKTKK